MKVRNDQRKTISLSQYEYVDLRIKDISAMEGITESVIIEEILLRKREPLFPASPCLLFLKSSAEADVKYIKRKYAPITP